MFVLNVDFLKEILVATQRVIHEISKLLHEIDLQDIDLGELAVIIVDDLQIEHVLSCGSPEQPHFRIKSVE